MIHYKLPLAEILMDFFDALKSRTRGYVVDYEFTGYVKSQLKLNVLLNGDPWTRIVHHHRDRAYPAEGVLRKAQRGHTQAV